jgi:hypothetical protein
VSLVGKRGAADLERLLHRGAHALPQDVVAATDLPPVGWRALGLDRDATRGDRLTVLATYAWILLWAAAFVVGTVLSATGTVSEAAWASFWHAFLLINLVAGIVVLFWFGILGLRDLGRMLRALRGRERDATDDGFVRREMP